METAYCLFPRSMGDERNLQEHEKYELRSFHSQKDLIYWVNLSPKATTHFLNALMYSTVNSVKAVLASQCSFNKQKRSCTGLRRRQSAILWRIDGQAWSICFDMRRFQTHRCNHTARRLTGGYEDFEVFRRAWNCLFGKPRNKDACCFIVVACWNNLNDLVPRK